jgi:putative oxidoreductase
MKIVVTISRLLLGLAFFVFGLNGFLHFIPSPPLHGLMLDFMTVIVGSHYYVVIFAVQAIAGLLLLIDQYVPLALVALAAVIVNILTFHATINPEGFPPAIIVTILWFVVAWSMRASFAGMLARKPE